MRIQGKDDLRELLAAEYVLGTLVGAARRRFERWMAQDPSLAHLVARWGTRLSPLAESIPDTNVPTRVWDALIKRIPALAPPQRAEPDNWWKNLNFWRASATAMAAVAVIAVGIALHDQERFTSRTPQTAAATSAAFVATFSDDKTHRPVAVMIIPENGNEVILQLVAADVVVPEGKTLELWTAKAQGNGMDPAGLVPTISTSRAVRFVVPDARVLRHATLLGLSLEPAGGSPAPTDVIGVATVSPIAS